MIIISFELLPFLPKSIQYVDDGIIGAIIYIIIAHLGWREKIEIYRRLVLGVCIGLLVYITGLPNSFTTVGLSYMGVDGIEAIFYQYKNPIMHNYKRLKRVLKNER